jgi:hypothetical protein
MTHTMELEDVAAERPMYKIASLFGFSSERSAARYMQVWAFMIPCNTLRPMLLLFAAALLCR